MLEGEAILLSMPEFADSSVQAELLVEVGQQCIVGVTSDECPASFVADVAGASKLPFPILYLSYPKVVNYSQNRLQKRTPVSLPASVQNNTSREPGFKASVVDLSLAGGRLLSAQEVGKCGDSVRCDIVTRVDGADYRLDLEGVVRFSRRVEGDSPGFMTGLEFSSISSGSSLVLRAFLHYQNEGELP